MASPARSRRPSTRCTWCSRAIFSNGRVAGPGTGHRALDQLPAADHDFRRDDQLRLAAAGGQDQAAQ